MQKSKMKEVFYNPSIVAIFSKISVVIISLLTSALINRLLGPEGKGEYSYYVNIITILVYFFSFGIGQTYSFFRKKKGIEVQNVFVVLGYCHGLIIALFSVLIFCYSHIYGLIFFICSISIIRFNLASICAVENVRKRDLFNLTVKFLYLILILVIYIKCEGIMWIVLIAYLLEELMQLLFMIFGYQLWPKRLLDINISVKSIYKLSFKSMLMLLLMTLNYHLDVLFLKQMSTNYETGIYSVAVTLANMLWLIPDALKDVVLHKSVRSDSRKSIIKLVKICSIVSVFVIIGFALLGKNMVVILYGDEFLEVYGVTLVLFVGTLSMVWYKIIQPYYIANGKQGVVVKILSISVVLNVILNILLIPTLGAIGAAVASVISYTCCGVYFLMIFLKECRAINREMK